MDRPQLTAEELLARGRAAAAALAGVPWATVDLGANLCLEHLRELARLAGVPVRLHVYADLLGFGGPGVIEGIHLCSAEAGSVAIRAGAEPRPPTSAELEVLGDKPSWSFDAVIPAT